MPQKQIVIKKLIDGVMYDLVPYIHPEHPSRGSGLYKITVDGRGHVTGATTVTKEDITNLGISPVGHTHNYAGSSSAGGTATSAAKLATARSIDGVDFNGSANITHYCTCATSGNEPNKVVNAPTGFKLIVGARIDVIFTEDSTVDRVHLNVNNTGLKAVYYRGYIMSNNELRIYANTVNTFIYDGVHWIYANIQSTVRQVSINDDVNYKLIMSASSYDNTEIGYTNKSSKFLVNPQKGTLTAPTFKGNLSGTATSAAKLATARSINDILFDGSSDIYLPSGRRWWVGSSVPNSAGYYRFLSKTFVDHEDFNITLAVTSEYSNNCNGIFYIHARCEDTVTCALPNKMGWLVRNGWTVDSIVVVRNGMTLDFYVNQIIPQWGGVCFTVLHESRLKSAASYRTISSGTTTSNLTPNQVSNDLGTVGIATKLTTTTAGSTSIPVYFESGIPKPCNYQLCKSVPSNAIFTDTKYETMKGATSSTNGSSGLVPVPTANRHTQFLKGDGTWANPSNNKVKNTLNSGVKAYVTGTTSSVTNTDSQVFDSHIYIDNVQGRLVSDFFHSTLGNQLIYEAEIGEPNSYDINFKEIFTYDVLLFKFRSSCSMSMYFDAIVPMQYINNKGTYNVYSSIVRRTAGSEGTSIAGFDTVVSMTKKNEDTITIALTNYGIHGSLGSIKIFTLM